MLIDIEGIALLPFKSDEITQPGTLWVKEGPTTARRCTKGKTDVEESLIANIFSGIDTYSLSYIQVVREKPRHLS